jgi:hypothetical protein
MTPSGSRPSIGISSTWRDRIVWPWPTRAPFGPVNTLAIAAGQPSATRRPNPPGVW